MNVTNNKDLFDLVLNNVCTQYKTNSLELVSKSRARDLVKVRSMICAVCCNQFKLQFTEIGRYFSKNHTTIMHLVKNVHEGYLLQDKFYKETYSTVIVELNTLLGKTNFTFYKDHIENHINQSRATIKYIKEQLEQLEVFIDDLERNKNLIENS